MATCALRRTELDLETVGAKRQYYIGSVQFSHSVGPLLIATGEAIPLRVLEGVPGLPGAPQDEAGLTRMFAALAAPQAGRPLHRSARVGRGWGCAPRLAILASAAAGHPEPAAHWYPPPLFTPSPSARALNISCPRWWAHFALSSFHSAPHPQPAPVGRLCLQFRSLGMPDVSDSLRPQDCSLRAPLSMEFSRQQYWSGLPFPSPRELPDPGIEPGSPALQVDSLPSESQHPNWYPSGITQSSSTQASKC